MISLHDRITDEGPLDGLTGMYGQDFHPGIILDHLDLAEKAGLVLVRLANGSLWLRDESTAPARPLLCGEIIRVETEDGPISGRCGLRLYGDGEDVFECPKHG